MTFQYIYYAVNSWLIFLCIALLLFYIIDVGVDCWIQHQKIKAYERKQRLKSILLEKYELNKVD
jgi:hypothetical protein